MGSGFRNSCAEQQSADHVNELFSEIRADLVGVEFVWLLSNCFVSLTIAEVNSVVCSGFLSV